MATELEFKLAVATPALLEQILFDKEIAQVRQGGYTLVTMATVYYDTPDKRLSQRQWTLRLRQENDTFVAALKTPGDGRSRGEWQCPAYSIHSAIPTLLEQGAPQELETLLQNQTILPVCAAQFSRRVAQLAFADGTVCELCGDIGALVGGSKEEELCELEVELKTGNADTAEAFAQELMDRFDLKEEPRSKFARAAALAKESSR